MVKTNLVLANKSESLRTTVPSHIVKQFKLKQGDQLDWELIAVSDSLKIVITPTREV